MRTAALILLLIGQDPARDPLTVLVDRLADERLAVRDEASREIVRLGEPVLGSLRMIVQATDDPEVRARLTDVIARIEADLRRHYFTGGPEVDGLKARLTVDLLTVKAGQDLKFTVEVMNVGAAAREFLVPLGVSRNGPGLTSTRSAWCVTLNVERKSGSEEPRRRLLRACGGRASTPQTMDLAPGQLWKTTVTVPVRLLSGVEEQPFVEGLTPGEYEARVTYPSAAGLSKELATNVIKFKVTE